MKIMTDKQFREGLENVGATPVNDCEVKKEVTRNG